MTKIEQVFIVTGSSRGIGAAIALELAKPGVGICVTYRSSKEPAENIEEQVKKRGAECIVVHADLSTQDGCNKVVTETMKAFGGGPPGCGRLTGIVNNAGIRSGTPFQETSEQEYEEVFNNDVKSCILMCAAGVPHMPQGGCIVNISSAVTHCPFDQQTVYTAGKGAIEAFTRALAVELAPKKIRVNAVSPGFTDTDMLPSDQYKVGEQQTPLSRVGKPEDIAKVVHFFIGPDSEWITGQNLIASGGFGYSL
ncbi:hypothetical protein HDU96_002011 [Phlyctochytrium bullatum]|nr:hypothetical protein HDU96_002011 [Phlyctochytrium bullatum]